MINDLSNEITIEQLTGYAEKIIAEVEKVLSGNRRRSRFPSLWDGHSAERIVQILASHFGLGAP